MNYYNNFTIIIKLIILFIFMTCINPSYSKEIIIPDDFPTIQSGINASSDGDKIIVKDGLYKENIIINKEISVTSVNGYTNTIIEANNEQNNIVSIIKNNVTFQGFSISGIGGNAISAIYITNAHNNTISYNKAGFNHNTDYGLHLNNSNNNSIQRNICINNSYGIYIYNSKNNYIYSNTCKSNWTGLKLLNSENNIFSKNEYTESDESISIESSINNIFNYNTFYSSLNAIISESCSDNIFYLNNFINNNKNLKSINSSNLWYSETKLSYLYNNNFYENYIGNYYDNHNLSDSNNDGLVDFIYILENDQSDKYPLNINSNNYILQQSSTVNFTISSQQIIEENQKINITAILDKKTDTYVYITLESSGSANGGGIDYMLDNKQIVIPAGSLTGSISLTIIDDDYQEIDETIVISMAKLVNANPGDLSSHTIIIESNDSLSFDKLDIYYPFNDNNANDNSGNNYHGTIYGAESTSDRFYINDSAFKFDGIDDYIEIENSQALDYSGQSFTLSVWINFIDDNISGQLIIGKFLYSNYNGYYIGVRDNFIEFFAGDKRESAIKTDEKFNDGKWHFVVGVHDGFTNRLYVDSILKKTIPLTYNTETNQNISIGGLKENIGAQFKGLIDDVYIFSRALNEKDIKSLYYLNYGINRPPNEPQCIKPSNNANYEPLSVLLSWYGDDPDISDIVTYDIYFDTDNPPQLIKENYINRSYTITNLEFDTVYYWKIVSKDNLNTKTHGQVWSFNTLPQSSLENNYPIIPYSPFPENNSYDIDTKITLEWASDDIDSDELKYDIYFGTINPPSYLTSSSYSFLTTSTLEYETKYFWKILAKDSHNAIVSSPIWSFKTIESQNKAPYVLNLNFEIEANTKLSQLLLGIDDENDKLVYSIVKQCDHGVLVLKDNINGNFSYTPLEDYTGIDYFSYIASDANQDSKTGIVTLTITPFNPAPIAYDINLTTRFNTPLQNNLNAKDSNDQFLIYSIVYNPEKGNISFLDINTGEFEYMPDNNYYGTDSFKYSVYDGKKHSDIAVVTITTQKKDLIPPIITLNGNNPLLMLSGNDYYEYGAKAVDNLDGEMIITGDNIYGNIDTSAPGQYTITYKASDIEGNTTMMNRLVYVFEHSLLSPSGNIIIDNEQDLEGFSITTNINDYLAKTNTNGNFNYTDIEISKNIIFSFYKQGYIKTSILYSNPDSLKDIIMHKAIGYDIVRGLFTDFNGSSLTECDKYPVIVEIQSDNYSNIAISDAYGRYTLSISQSLESYTLTASKYGYESKLFTRTEASNVELMKKTNILISEPIPLIFENSQTPQCIDYTITCIPPFIGSQNEISINPEENNKILRYNSDSKSYLIRHNEYERFNLEILADTSEDRNINKGYYNVKQVTFEDIPQSVKSFQSVSEMNIYPALPVYINSKKSDSKVSIVIDHSDFVLRSIPEKIHVKIIEYENIISDIPEINYTGNIVEILITDELGYDVAKRQNNFFKKASITISYPEIITKENINEYEIFVANNMTDIIRGNGQVLSLDEVEINEANKTLKITTDHLSVFAIRKIYEPQEQLPYRYYEESDEGLCFINTLGILQ